MKKIILFLCSLVLISCTAIDNSNVEITDLAGIDGLPVNTDYIKEDKEAQYELGYYYDISKKMDLAKKYYELASEQGHSEAQFRLGYIYYNEKKYDLAEKYWKLAGEQSDEKALGNLGLLYKEQGKMDLAKKYIKKSSDLGNAQSHANLGIIYENEGKYDLAEEYYELAIFNNYSEAKKLLSNLRKKQRKRIKSPSKFCMGRGSLEEEYITEEVFSTLRLLEFLERKKEFKAFSAYQGELTEYKEAIKHMLKNHLEDFSKNQIEVLQELYLYIDENLRKMKSIKEIEL